MPHALRPLRQDDDATGMLAMLAGFDEDLAAQVNQLSNRIRGLLTQIHPALERVLGARLQHPAALELLQRYPSPQALRSAGRTRVAARLRRRAPRLADRLAEQIMAALGEQTVVVTGTDAAALVLAAGGAGMTVLAFRSTSLTLLALWLLIRRPPGRPARGDVPIWVRWESRTSLPAAPTPPLRPPQVHC